MTGPPQEGTAAGRCEAALATLRQAYERRGCAAAELAAGGSGVVGYAGTVVPADLIAAAGFTPVRVAADAAHPIEAGDAYMEEAFGWELRSMFDGILSGRWEALRLLVIDRTFAPLYSYLKEVVRLGDGSRVPPLFMFDFIQAAQPSLRRHNADRVRDLIAALERLAGEPLDPQQVEVAFGRGNLRGAQLRTLEERRYQACLTGVDALRVIGAGYFMAPGAYAGTLRDFLAGAVPDPSLADRPRLLAVSSEALYHTLLHETLEDAGGLVVAEDDWWGSRAAGGRIPAGRPLDETVLTICEQASAGPRAHPYRARLSWLSDRIARCHIDRIDAVVVHMPPSDQIFGWDYPRIRSMLDQAGLPHLLLRDDVLDPRGRDRTVGHVREFLADARPALADAPQRGA